MKQRRGPTWTERELQLLARAAHAAYTGGADGGFEASLFDNYMRFTKADRGASPDGLHFAFERSCKACADRWNKLRDSFRFVVDFEAGRLPPVADPAVDPADPLAASAAAIVVAAAASPASWWALDERTDRKAVLNLYRKQSIPRSVFDMLYSWLPAILAASHQWIARSSLSAQMLHQQHQQHQQYQQHPLLPAQPSTLAPHHQHPASESGSDSARKQLARSYADQQPPRLHPARQPFYQHPPASQPPYPGPSFVAHHTERLAAAPQLPPPQHALRAAASSTPAHEPAPLSRPTAASSPYSSIPPISSLLAASPMDSYSPQSQHHAVPRPPQSHRRMSFDEQARQLPAPSASPHAQPVRSPAAASLASSASGPAHRPVSPHTEPKHPVTPRSHPHPLAQEYPQQQFGSMAGQQLRASHIALGKRPMPSEFEDSPPAPMRPRTYSGTPIGQNRSHLSALAEAAFSFSSPSSNAHSSQHIPLDPEAPSARKQEMTDESAGSASRTSFDGAAPASSYSSHPTQGHKQDSRNKYAAREHKAELPASRLQLDMSLGGSSGTSESAAVARTTTPASAPVAPVSTTSLANGRHIPALPSASAPPRPSAQRMPPPPTASVQNRFTPQPPLPTAAASSSSRGLGPVGFDRAPPTAFGMAPRQSSHIPGMQDMRPGPSGKAPSHPMFAPGKAMGAYDPARMAGQPGRPGHPGAPTAQRMTLAREEVIDPNDSFEPGTLRLIPIPSESAPGKTASAQASPRSPAKSLEKDVRPAAGEGNPAAAEMPGNPAVPTSSAFMGAQPAKSARSPAHPTREHSPSLLSIRMATDLSPGSLVPKSAAEASIVSQIKDLVRDWREQESRFHDRLSSLVDSLEHSRGLHDKPTAPSPARLPSPTIVSPTSLSVSAAEEVPALVRQDAPSLSETTAQAAFEMPARAV